MGKRAGGGVSKRHGECDETNSFIASGPYFSKKKRCMTGVKLRQISLNASSFPSPFWSLSRFRHSRCAHSERPKRGRW